MNRVQISITVLPKTADYIRNSAVSHRAYGAYVDQLVQKERLKSVTLEKLNDKLSKLMEQQRNVIEAIQQDCNHMLGKLRHDRVNGNLRGKHWAISCRTAINYKKAEIKLLEQYLEG